MTRRHFELIAGVIRISPLAEGPKITIALAFADALEETNESFDYIRFLVACGVRRA